MPPCKKSAMGKFGDICHVFALVMRYLPIVSCFLAFFSAISRCMTFLQIPDANVHIAAIVFFDMLTNADCNLHNITVKTKNRVG